MTALPKLKPTATLPAILAIVGYQDFGPSDGEGSTSCPHCGARGRHVWYFICEDGSKRGAMRGCLQLFPQAAGTSRYARLIQEAFDRQAKAKEEGKKLASWWAEMIDAAEEFRSQSLPDHAAIQAALLVLHRKVAAAEGRRQYWLNKNGYGKFVRRRR